jgi:hypothetical protein
MNTLEMYDAVPARERDAEIGRIDAGERRDVIGDFPLVALRSGGRQSLGKEAGYFHRATLKVFPPRVNQSHACADDIYPTYSRNRPLWDKYAPHRAFYR